VRIHYADHNDMSGRQNSAKKEKGRFALSCHCRHVNSFSIAFGMSAVSVGRVKSLHNIGNSIVAFYAAETGIERGLREAVDGSYSIPHDYLDLDGDGVEGPDDAIYQVQGLNNGEGNCPVTYSFCLKSKGIYKDSSRSIQVNMK